METLIWHSKHDIGLLSQRFFGSGINGNSPTLLTLVDFWSQRFFGSGINGNQIEKGRLRAEAFCLNASSEAELMETVPSCDQGCSLD